LTFAAGVTVAAQVPSPRDVPPEAFAVASVKPNRSRAVQWDFDTPPGRVVGTNVVLRDVIRFAYYIYGGDWDARIAGPDWIKSARFDIDARSAEPVTTPRAMSMLRQLLADRFHLKARFEQREAPVLALVLVHREGRLGPRLTASRSNCAAVEAANQAARAGGTIPGPPGDPAGRPTCGSRGGRGSLSIGGLTMEQIALTLTSHVGRQIVNRTGLKGEFDLDLEWMPEPAAGDLDPASRGAGPSIFTALEEQAGLKLESARAPIEVLVIDSIEQPTAD
jgi:uncharacterized protein (TIGR03435 family)